MANNLSSNITRKVARVFLDKFESSRVLTRTVDTQLLSNQFNPSTGSTVDFKRPTDYKSIRTAGGDITYGRLIREKNLIGKALKREESPYGSLDEATLKRLYG